MHHVVGTEEKSSVPHTGWPIVFRVPEESHIPHPFVMNHSMDTARIVAGEFVWMRFFGSLSPCFRDDFSACVALRPAVAA